LTQHLNRPQVVAWVPLSDVRANNMCEFWDDSHLTLHSKEESNLASTTSQAEFEAFVKCSRH
jgi:hypothetical protein